MNLLAFDIGGSSVKYGLWKNEKLAEQDSFPLPKDWIEMKQILKQIFDQKSQVGTLAGVAFSAPGVVDDKKGEIRGVSAVSYIHHFPIREELETLFGVPVSMENDANCAALAEVWQGAAKDVSDSIFFVIGTGIGGAVIIDRKLFKGRNLFGGEFGYMALNESSSLSDLGSSVKIVKKYNLINGTQIDGKELFERAEKEDLLAIQLVEQFYAAIARGIYNLLVCFDSGRVVLGGGVSKNERLLPNIQRHLTRILLEHAVTDMDYELVTCKFGNDANLIGAVYHFMENNA
ncbi:ROK family protein [Enterococcus sp. AZ192]|uniref:ROK family protein n=1 Tax=unclassified Enterococcus TaxID=2608891 RepID=UPI003D285D72